MKRIWIIGKNELYNLYYSPIAWVVLILFLLQYCVIYFAVLEGELRIFETGTGIILRGMTELTDKIATEPPNWYFGLGVFRSVEKIFPLITMGLISREMNKGTIRLLHSSPVRISEIVLGKFLAMAIFSFILIVTIGFSVISLALSIVHVDIWHLLFSLTGLFLLLCMYGAIGIFLSSVSTYQVVAALSTLAVFMLLNMIGYWGQQIDWIRNITFYLDLNNKMVNLIRGLFNLRDIAYCCIFTGCFLSFTVIRMRNAIESVAWWRKMLRYAVVLIIVFLVGAITEKPGINVFYDSTRNKILTISSPVQKMLAGMDEGPLEIIAYGNLVDYSFSFFNPGNRNELNYRLWDNYIRFKPDIHITYRYYYDLAPDDYHYQYNPGKTLKEIAAREAKIRNLPISLFMTPDQVRKEVNVDKEELRSFFVLKYKGRSTILRVYDDFTHPLPTDVEIAAALNRLTGVSPKVLFVTGELERGIYDMQDRGYRYFAAKRSEWRALINQGYDVDTLNLEQDIPAGLTALVIADPRKSFSPASLQKISRYLEQGGNLMITVEPDRKDIAQPILDNLGVTLRPGLLVQPNDKFSSDNIFSEMTDTLLNVHEMAKRFVKVDRRCFYDSLSFKIPMIGANALDYKEQNGFHIVPLTCTDSLLAWNRVVPITQDSLTLKVKSVTGDEHRRFPTSILMERQVNGKQQRVIVAGDADHLTLSAIREAHSPKAYNNIYAGWIMSYFTYGKFPVNTLHPESIDNKFKIKTASVKYHKMVLYYVVPAFIGLAASVILIRRKRK